MKLALRIKRRYTALKGPNIASPDQHSLTCYFYNTHQEPKDLVICFKDYLSAILLPGSLLENRTGCDYTDKKACSKAH